MPGCAVTGCLSYSRKTKGTDIIYHSFPKDVKVQKAWIMKCHRKDRFNVVTSTVCSLHFTSDDYLRDLRAELLNLPPKKTLKPDAVPSVNIPGSVPSVSGNSGPDDTVSPNRADRLQARKTMKNAIEHLVSVSPKKRKIDQSTATDDYDTDSKQTSELCKRIEELENRNRRLTAMCENLRCSEKRLKLKVNACGEKIKYQQKCQKKQVQEKVTQIFRQIVFKNTDKLLVDWKETSKMAKGGYL
ncbi:uncharacterized protein LOC126101611 [Schistocerca cancellata]|uniref:uncharacterized protein LOC126101611 n=1 Tax=Schistocerca cancellata TaxID=274614 RepID=UPI0021186FCE|nr:uncharacterized protein LOC126101611 [Schistocerca cancellata]